MEKERKSLFTSESVSEGHPDKLCDRVSDAILDACLALDPYSSVACECFASKQILVIGGEITCEGFEKNNIEEVARRVIKDIGYDKEEYEFDDKNVKIINLIKGQSPDIAQAVRKTNLENLGAGDQGFAFGYATNETEGYMPLAISIAHKLMRIATKLRKEGKFRWARPDMKSQVTIDYADPSNLKIDTCLVSIQHDGDYVESEFKDYIINEIILPTLKSFGFETADKIIVNPSGRFVLGGPSGDTGLTGRKIIVDTYGGGARHGGGAFSGKDPTKVDRSGAYMARYIAKNLVAAGLADRIEIQIAYAIGLSKPVSVGFSTFGTAHYSDDIISDVIDKFFNAAPGNIITQFSLNKPSFKYEEISNYGHLGRPDMNLPWEQLDKVEEIKNYLK